LGTMVGRDQRPARDCLFHHRLGRCRVLQRRCRVPIRSRSYRRPPWRGPCSACGCGACLSLSPLRLGDDRKTENRHQAAARTRRPPNARPDARA
jgi:hypothetical protein